MATSGTTTFNPDILELIEEAYEMVGVEVRSGYDLKTARRSLDLLMREWQNRGLNFWTIDQESAAILAADTTLTLDSSTIDVLDVAWRNSSDIDRTMVRMSMPEYLHIANKEQTGQPTQFFINRNVATPILYFWPIPVDAGTLVYYRIRKIEDAGSYTNTVDVPTRFMPALTSGLAFYLAMKTPSAAPRIPMLQAEYERQFEYAASEDRERASFRFVPDMSSY